MSTLIEQIEALQADMLKVGVTKWAYELAPILAAVGAQEKDLADAIVCRDSWQEQWALRCEMLDRQVEITEKLEQELAAMKEPMECGHPWAWGIETPGGDMYDGEYAVFGDEFSCRSQVETLNDEIPDGEPMFKLVPLFSAKQHSDDLREIAEMALRMGMCDPTLAQLVSGADRVLTAFREKQQKAEVKAQ